MSLKFPPWLRQTLPSNHEYSKTKELLDHASLHTVCEEAKCPNRFICFEKKCATFLALGKFCTRQCAFCDISFSKSPLPLDNREPKKIALSAKKLKLKHIVITMVTRDDLLDGGANHLSKIIKEVKAENKGCVIEVLTSDFQGKENLLDIVIDAKPDIFNHNIETIKRLSPTIRNKATYKKSLAILKYVKKRDSSIHVKSGLMVGFNETKNEVKETIDDLKNHCVDIITIGQYLQPSNKCIKVNRYVHPEEFKSYENMGIL